MSADTYDREYTRQELEAEAEKLAQASSLRTNARDAWDRVRRGELEGTMFASELAGIFFLLGQDEPLPQAAE